MPLKKKDCKCALEAEDQWEECDTYTGIPFDIKSYEYRLVIRVNCSDIKTIMDNIEGYGEIISIERQQKEE